MVEVEVITRDKNGAFVGDLALDDFELREDGKPYPVQRLYLRVTRPIRWANTLRGSATAGAASRVSPPPDSAHRIFVVVFDDAHLSLGGFERTRAAALSLFQTQLHDGDVGGIVVNGRMANGRLTSDRAELVKAVKDAKPIANVLSAQFDERIWPRISEIEAVRIVVNDDKEMMDLVTRRACDEQKGVCDGPGGEDAVRGMIHGKAVQSSTNVRVEATRTLTMIQSVLTGLARLAGPKRVLLMSEGFISEETWPEVQDAVSKAARADTRIYTLDARGLERGMASIESVAPAEAISRMFEQMDMGADSINSIAVDTGGFVVRNTNQFDNAIARIADDASNYYVLGYLPPSPADGKFHRISVNVKRKDVSVRARRGYTGVPRTVPAMIAATAPRTDSATVVSGFSRTVPAVPEPEPAAPSVRLKPGPTNELPSVRLKPDTTEVSTTAASSANSGVRLRPNASKHIDTLLPDPAADRAAAAGWEAYQRGDVAGARTALAVAAASPTAQAWVHYALGLSEYALGDYAGAVVEWERVQAAAKTFEPVYFDLVDGYLQLKQHDKAIRLLREGAASWPEDPDIFNALGVVQTSRGALPDAIASFGHAVKVSPAEAVAYFNLGRVYELRYFRSRRYVAATKRWIADEKDRTAAMENYERYLSFGGPFTDPARDGMTRLRWAASSQ